MTKKNIIKCLRVLFGLCTCIMLVWCWSNSDKNQTEINVWDFVLTYGSNIKLEKINVKNDDLGEIMELYQETWEDLDYKDSLLIAEKYSQWLGVLAFVQNNLDTLEEQWLTLKNIKKSQVSLDSLWKSKNAILLEYEITEWFIPEIPLLYLSQLFIPIDDNIILLSFMSENINVRNSASSMFKNIK